MPHSIERGAINTSDYRVTFFWLVSALPHEILCGIEYRIQTCRCRSVLSYKPLFMCRNTLERGLLPLAVYPDRDAENTSSPTFDGPHSTVADSPGGTKQVIPVFISPR